MSAPGEPIAREPLERRSLEDGSGWRDPSRLRYLQEGFALKSVLAGGGVGWCTRDLGIPETRVYPESLARVYPDHAGEGGGE